jgi:hypothetical protein
VVNKKLCHRLFIEAENAEQANEIAKSLGVYFNGKEKGIDCECRGDRWYEVSEDDVVDLKAASEWMNVELKSIEDYAQSLAEYGWTYPEARVFYLSGKVVEIFKK